MSNGVVVVGAGLGGLRVVESLRRLGYTDPVTLIGAERHLPYDRPPLTKQVLRGERDSTTLRAELDSLDVTALLGCEAVELDASAGVVRLRDGRTVPYDHVVLAPGGRARTLPRTPGRAGLHVLRSIDDALALRAAATAAGSVTVIGGGFVGCEAAASFRALGVEVHLVELEAQPLCRALGPVVGTLVAGLLESHGVVLHRGCRVDEVLGTEHVTGVGLSDGTRLDTPEVLVGLGIEPEVAWLEGSGVVVDDGIVCDAAGRTAAPGVFAVGDAANWHQPLLGVRRRLEHWTTTVEQAKTVAQAICGDDAAELTEVPYFWSDLFDVKIQALGYVDPAHDVQRFDVNGRAVFLYSDDGVLRGVLGFSAARTVMKLRGLIAAGAQVGDALGMLESA